MAEIQYYGTGRRKTSVARVYLRPGSGKIVVNRGLLTELESEAELAAVLAHEIVHADDHTDVTQAPAVPREVDV